jgi:hypothetical protein
LEIGEDACGGQHLDVTESVDDEVEFQKLVAADLPVSSLQQD